MTVVVVVTLEPRWVSVQLALSACCRCTVSAVLGRSETTCFVYSLRVDRRAAVGTGQPVADWSTRPHKWIDCLANTDFWTLARPFGFYTVSTLLLHRVSTLVYTSTLTLADFLSTGLKSQLRPPIPCYFNKSLKNCRLVTRFLSDLGSDLQEPLSQVVCCLSVNN